MGVLTGQRILITSGPTWARIDTVRYLGNRSSGRFGTAVAERCLAAGAEVILLAGPGSQVPGDESPALHVQRFESLMELQTQLEANLGSGDVHAVIQAVAGLDYIPKNVETGKISSDRGEITLELVQAPKLIEKIKDWSPRSVLIGCKLETKLDDESLFQRADDLHERSRAELVVANRMEEVGEDRHRAFLVSWPDGDRVVTGPIDGRDAIAESLVVWLAHHLGADNKDEA